MGWGVGGGSSISGRVGEWSRVFTEFACVDQEQEMHAHTSQAARVVPKSAPCACVERGGGWKEGDKTWVHLRH